MTPLIKIRDHWIQPAHVKHLAPEPGRESCRIFFVDGRHVTVGIDHDAAARKINEALEWQA